MTCRFCHRPSNPCRTIAERDGCVHKPEKPMKAPKSCRTCKFLVVPPDADGKIRVRKDEYYLCQPPIKPVEDLGLPASITATMNSRGWNDFRWPPHAQRMHPNDPASANCPCYEKRTK